MVVALSMAACTVPSSADAGRAAAPNTFGTESAVGAVTSGTSAGSQPANPTEAQELQRDLAINELHPVYVEVYFVGAVRDSIQTDGLAIIVNERWGAPCQLDGASVDESRRYLVVQAPQGDCLGGGGCVYCASLSVHPGDTVQLMQDADGVWELIDTQAADYPAMDTGDSFQAVPDGSDDFTRKRQTVGEAN